MTNRLGILVWILLSFVLQTTIFPDLFRALAEFTGFHFLAGCTVDLALITLFYLSFHRDFVGALIWAAVTSVIASSFGLWWKGAATTAYFTVVTIGSFSKNQFMSEGVPMLMSMAGIFSFIEGMTHLGAGYVLSRIPGYILWSQIGIVLEQAFINAICAPLICYLLFLFDDWTGHRLEGRQKTLLIE